MDAINWWALGSGVGGVVAGVLVSAWRTRAAHGGFRKALGAVIQGGGGPGEEQ